VYGAGSALVARYNPKTDTVVAMYENRDPARMATREGISVGSTEAQVLSTYAANTVVKHLAGDFGQGSSGIAVQGDGGWLGFTIADGKVSAVRVGASQAYAGNAETGC